MIELLAAFLGYPLTPTVALIEAIWVTVGLVCWLLASRKWTFARAYEKGRVEAGQNGDRRITSRMNLRTAVMAMVVASTLLLVGAIAMMTPPRMDVHVMSAVFSQLVLLLFEVWFARWLVLDWRDALELRERLERAFRTDGIADHAQETADHAQETADQAQGVADSLRTADEREVAP